MSTNTEKNQQSEALETIRIKKDDYITTEEDLQQGMDRTIPLDKLRSNIVLELALPVQKDGKEVSEIKIHPPKTIDVKRWRNTPNPSQSMDTFMVKCLKHWSPTDLEILEPYDYLRVQKVIMHFL